MTERAAAIARAGDWTGEPVDRVVLAFDDRYRRRIRLACTGGFAVLLDLPEPVVLQDGDGLRLDSGGIVEVVAADEPLMEAVPGEGVKIARLAWHIGNRHLEAEIGEDWIRLRRDHVIKDMLEGLGASVREIEAPFRPEGGAYGHGRTYGHDHGHGHAHDHSHGHAHGHDHAHSHRHDGDPEP